MLPLGQLVGDEPWLTRRFHIWYMYASAAGMSEIDVRVPAALFHLEGEGDFHFNLTFHDVHRMMRRKELGLSHVTLFTM